MSNPNPAWVIMPVMAGEALTDAAISDVLSQSVPTRLLLIGQGISGAWRSHLLQVAEESDGRLLLWMHDPPLPSLSATWNRALEFVWSAGEREAVVINNDVRLDEYTVVRLSHARRYADALFVSAVGVTGEQFAARESLALGDRLPIQWFVNGGPELQKGGPDFSCFLITKEGHLQFPFDEGFTPAFCEDLDTHRRYMLAGEGERIFSINLPFHHVGHGSQTLKSMDPDRRAKHERAIGQSRAHYQRKWGGPVNGERFTIPFEPRSDQDGVTTPDLQRAVQGGGGATLLQGPGLITIEIDEPGDEDPFADQRPVEDPS